MLLRGNDGGFWVAGCVCDIVVGGAGGVVVMLVNMLMRRLESWVCGMLLDRHFDCVLFNQLELI